MLYFAALAHFDRRAVAIHPSKTCGEAVVVILRPSVARIRMAASAAVLGHVAGIGCECEEVRRAGACRVASCGEQRARELIERCSRRDLAVQPLVILPSGALAGT